MRDVSVVWEHLEVGPAVRPSDGVEVAPAAGHDVPVGLRLNFEDVPVWFVAGMPDWPKSDRVLLMGDEIMVVFEAHRLQAFGFPDGQFTRSPAGS